MTQTKCGTLRTLSLSALVNGLASQIRLWWVLCLPCATPGTGWAARLHVLFASYMLKPPKVLLLVCILSFGEPAQRKCGCVCRQHRTHPSLSMAYLRGAPRPPNDRNAAIFAAIVEPRRGVPSAMAVNSCSCPSAGVHVTSNICNSLRFGCIIASSKAHSFRAHFNPSSRSNEDRRQGLREGTTSSATSSVYICR